MDPLIRSALLAPHRTRLSETAAGRAGVPDAQQVVQRSDPRSAQEALRAEIEKQVRSELAAHMQKFYDSERERARAAGHAAAVAETQESVAKQVAELREQLEANADSALSALQQAQQAALAKLESSVGEIAFAAVCRLVGEKAMSRPFVLGLVEHTCAQLRADAIATARLHPRDVQTLGELLQDHELRLQSVGLKVVADESLALGGCVIEASSGRYDGSLESQLRRLHAVLASS
jgi:flagellar assembly protein FliH